MDSIRKVVGQMEDEENRLLEKRSGDSKQSVDQTHSTITYRIPLTVVLLALVGFWITCIPAAQ